MAGMVGKAEKDLRVPPENPRTTGEAGKPGTNKPAPGPPGPKGSAGRPGLEGPQGLKGFVGSDQYNHYGGGGEYICLPNNPKYDKYKDGYQSESYIYGTEYEVSGYNPFKNNLHDHDAPCAVCYVKSRATQLMIPARNDCPSGWTKEYYGYLMSGPPWPQEISQFHLALTGMQSLFTAATPARMAPFCTSWKESAARYHASRTLLAES
ncbi:hypothetical protein OS493_038395 [Desmophyllum pertusum]|uniref:Uncharacterized protein n=1 Tax=Desmophyllum pertusum TaxID=174260 RepID=A0A9W9YHF4_9CNID|nr:hypothetical protein OS493_038395 [Desmophyllum pertusum]